MSVIVGGNKDIDKEEDNSVLSLSLEIGKRNLVRPRWVLEKELTI